MSEPGGTVFNTDTLPPTEYLILEVLAARARLGEHSWTFPARLNKSLGVLARRGLVNWKAATIERHSVAWLTPLGRAGALSADYVPPANPDLAAIREQASRYLVARFGEDYVYRAPETFSNLVERWIWALAGGSREMAERCMAAIEKHVNGEPR